MAKRVIRDAVEGDPEATNNRRDDVTTPGRGDQASHDVAGENASEATPANPFPGYDPEELLRVLESFDEGDPDEQIETFKALRAALNEGRFPGYLMLP